MHHKNSDSANAQTITAEINTSIGSIINNQYFAEQLAIFHGWIKPLRTEDDLMFEPGNLKHRKFDNF